MNFLSPSVYSADSSFTPLFRLLDDFDNYSRQGSTGGQTRRLGLSQWQPKFDVRETGDHYELHGELPGMNKEHVHVEFTEPQTMLIRGKVERTYTAGAPPTGYIGDNGSSGAITQGDEAKPSHQATVEDEDASKSGTGVVTKRSDSKKPADRAKYWLSERSVGEFSRSFSFPSPVDQDAVSANFKDGILSITVPKARKQESRRIAIQ